MCEYHGDSHPLFRSRGHEVLVYSARKGNRPRFCLGMEEGLLPLQQRGTDDVFFSNTFSSTEFIFSRERRGSQV